MDNTFLHSKKLLLIDDEPELLKMITVILADEGFPYLVTALNMKEGIAVIFLTARDEAVDRLAGLGLGADDYITKPFFAFAEEEYYDIFEKYSNATVVSFAYGASDAQDNASAAP